MSQTIEIIHECCSCGGTGLYSGMGEGEGAAVVCSRCEGKGWEKSSFKAFSGRKKKAGIKRVYQANPGIGIGEGGGHKLEDFGGIPIADWLDGKPFPRGSEMRRFVCPRWWYQSAGGRKVEWDDCRQCLGSRFSQCKKFASKNECWERYDREVKP